MSELQVLVATMKQQDLSLAERMNLRADAIIANQHDKSETVEALTEYGKIKMITTPTRGVGLNRNIALTAADADILLFADDDIIYYDNALEEVKRAFSALPDADIIFFGLDMTRDGKIYERRRHPIKRLHLYNSMRFGGARIAIRRDALMRARLSFSRLFGGGCIYGSGEDSLFIRDCFRAGLRVYSHSVVLGKCAKDSSTWFEGFNEKYIFDKGAWMACAFPRGKHLLKWHFIRRIAKRAGLSLGQTAKIFNRGMKAYKTLATYQA